MIRLLLVRHGETEWNNAGRLQGQTDVDLSELGIRQAEALGARLASEPLAGAYSSDLRRSWDTATIALAGRDVPLVPEPGLREIHLGDWQGSTFAELRLRTPEDLDRVNADPLGASPRGGESRRQLQERIVAAITSIAARHEVGQFLIVSHGGALRAFACWLLMADLRASSRLESDNCGLSVVEFIGDLPRLIRWNDVSHLGSLREPPSHGRQTE